MENFLKYSLSNAWGFNKMPRPGSHKLSGGTGGLTENKECWHSVFEMNWWKIPYLKHRACSSPVQIYTTRSIDSLSIAAECQIKTEQRNKTFFEQLPSVGPEPGLPCRPPAPWHRPVPAVNSIIGVGTKPAVFLFKSICPIV